MAPWLQARRHASTHAPATSLLTAHIPHLPTCHRVMRLAITLLPRRPVPAIPAAPTHDTQPIPAVIAPVRTIARPLPSQGGWYTSAGVHVISGQRHPRASRPGGAACFISRTPSTRKHIHRSVSHSTSVSPRRIGRRTHRSHVGLGAAQPADTRAIERSPTAGSPRIRGWSTLLARMPRLPRLANPGP
jgi:hypothetical protein